MEEIFINVNEFQETILKYIYSDEMDKIVGSTIFKEVPNGKQAIMYGMLMAAMITSKCTQYRIVKDKEGNKNEN